MFEEKRKYFDYELAYEGYLKAKELFDKGGVEELINDEEFDISGGATIEEWSCNGYLPLYASGYNITLYLSDRNFDTENENNDWYISGEVDIYSYSGGDDNLFINDKETIEDRINNLLDYANKNDYSIEDYEKELESLEKVLSFLQKQVQISAI